jgi:hypothetical protein
MMEAWLEVQGLVLTITRLAAILVAGFVRKCLLSPLALLASHLPAAC